MNRLKIASLGLSLMMLGTSVLVFGGCSKKTNKVEIISKDSTWYDSKEVIFEAPEKLSDDTYGYVYQYNIVNDGVVTCYEIYDETTYESKTYLVEYDLEGNILSKIDTSKLIKTPSKESYTYINQIFASKDGFKAIVNVTEYTPMDYKSTDYLYDSKTQKCENFKPFSKIMGEENNTYIEYAFERDNGDYVFLASTYDWERGTNESNLIICDDNDVKKTEDMKKLVNNEDFDYFSSATLTGNILSVYYNCQGESATYLAEVNLDTKEVTTSEVKTSYNTSVADDGNSYYVTPEGVFEVSDASDDGEKTPVISFDDCNIKRGSLWGMRVAHIDEEGCVILGDAYDEDRGSYIKSLILTKADENPNAGKKVINVGYLGYVSDMVYEAIYDFNDTNEKNFIRFTDKYSSEDGFDGDFYENGEFSEEKYLEAMNDYYAEMIDSLSIDLISGDAPDIILNCNQYNQVKTDKYLEDLIPYIEKDFSEDDFFVNVVDSCKTGKNLFCMPITFNAYGLLCDSKKAGDKDGFTFDEYLKFVDKELNGNDPLAMYSTRALYFEQLYEAMSDLFYDENGKVSFQNDDFYALAEYCKEHVPEKGQEYGDDYYTVDIGYDDCEGYYSVANTTSLNSIQWFVNDAYEKGKLTKSLYGLPSSDGRGPIINVEVSASISSMSGNKDGSWEFIKTLLSDDIQEKCCSDYYTNGVNIEACRDGSLDIIRELNKDNERMAKMDPMYAEYYPTYDESCVDEYIDILSSASTYNGSDPAIYKIVSEEIQAYFAGQKSIEEVTETMENRAKTVMDERG